jgi:tetratricopeptide (TPR) repeat protein
MPLRSAFPGSEIEILKSSNTSSRKFFIRAYSSAEEYIERLEFHKKNARLIDSDTLIKFYFDLKVRANTVAELRRKRGEDFFSSNMNDENVHATAIHVVIDERREAGDLNATFGSALIWYQGCATMVKNKGDAALFCGKVVDGLRFSSENSDPRAYVVLGMMHEEGIWYERSNFLAAENYFSAAQIYDRLGNRGGTLINIEKATRLWPNNPRFVEFLSRISR